jgi:hypothetical protein
MWKRMEIILHKTGNRYQDVKEVVNLHQEVHWDHSVWIRTGKGLIICFITLISWRGEIQSEMSIYAYTVPWLSSPHHHSSSPSPHLKWLQKVPLLYFIHQQNSPSFSWSFHPPPSHMYPAPHRTKFTILSFIFNSIFIVQKSFLMCCEYTVLAQINPLYYFPLPFPSTPCVIYMHRYSVFWYCWLSIILFFISGTLLSPRDGTVFCMQWNLLSSISLSLL